eukprot:2088346-Rhodomonas_salina.1
MLQGSFVQKLALASDEERLGDPAKKELAQMCSDVSRAMMVRARIAELMDEAPEGLKKEIEEVNGYGLYKRVAKRLEVIATGEREEQHARTIAAELLKDASLLEHVRSEEGKDDEVDDGPSQGTGGVQGSEMPSGEELSLIHI